MHEKMKTQSKPMAVGDRSAGQFTLLPNPIYTQIDDEIVVCSPKTSDFYAISEVGTVLWRLIESKSVSLVEMIEHLTLIYDVDEEQAAQDIIVFLDDMKAQGLITHDL